jgi:UDP-N-acetylmuramoyl-tripeptide--D-alanyl-D-alanine ligase
MSVSFRAQDAADWTGGSLLQGRPELRFTGASIDTRSVAAGDLFIAIVGPSHDAHRFLPAAIAGGAAGLVIERGRALPAEIKPDVPVIAVDDTTRALGALAAGHRAGFRGPVVGITGSNGKTTTKEMCAAILSVGAPCLKNEGNLNNQFGLPLTLLRRDERDRRIVVEIGMNHRGEVAALAAIARPTVGVLTNVGTAHIEYLGSQDEIAREKGDLLASLPADGTAVVNADDPRAAAQADRSHARVVRFGRGPDADVRAEHVSERDGRGFALELHSPQGRTAVEVAGVGEIAIQNALAAAAAALAAGATLDQVAAGLAAHRPVRGRMERRDLPGDIVVLDDTYNANPQSMEAALQSLARAKGEHRGLVVVGDMGELGEASAEAHARVGRRAAALGLDGLFALGEHAEGVAAAALEAGMPPECVHVDSDHAGLAAQLRSVLRRGDWILVKGSRAMQMERVVEELAREGVH